MKKNIGKCPFCDSGFIIHKTIVTRGMPTNIFVCSNASWHSEDGELFELSKNATCSFRIYGNSLQRWGKKKITTKEVKTLLEGKDIKVKLYSFRAKKEYYKFITLDKEFGISVLWDIDIKD